MFYLIKNIIDMIYKNDKIIGASVKPNFNINKVDDVETGKISHCIITIY